jgi:hypothetical protein
MTKTNDLPEIEKHARDAMHKAIENTWREFATIRPARPPPAC